MPATAPPLCVAIPARDERDHIGPCLDALARQRGAALHHAVLCCNNCTDDTAAIARQRSMPFALTIIETALPPAIACAGAARRIALERAAGIIGPDGVLLTTDADGVVAPDWLAANLAALAAGAEAVAGRARIDPIGARTIPAHLHALDREECAYAALLDEIDALIDPDPADPWPRHDEHTGASIAVTVAAYCRAGGMPAAPIGEDRAFFAALRRVDARIRHAPAAVVTVSARIVGRAAGGMADTIRRRIGTPDAFADDRLEPAALALRRLAARARARAAWRDLRRGYSVAGLAKRLHLDGDMVRAALGARYFGIAWESIEAASPVLRRAPLAYAALARESASAMAIRNLIRARQAGRADRTLRDAAD